MTHLCVSDLVHHLGKFWFVDCSVPSYNLKHWWYIVDWTHANIFQAHLDRKEAIFIQENIFEFDVSKMAAILCLDFNVFKANIREVSLRKHTAGYTEFSTIILSIKCHSI